MTAQEEREGQGQFLNDTWIVPSETSSDTSELIENVTDKNVTIMLEYLGKN